VLGVAGHSTLPVEPYSGATLEDCKELLCQRHPDTGAHTVHWSSSSAYDYHVDNYFGLKMRSSRMPIICFTPGPSRNRRYKLCHLTDQVEGARTSVHQCDNIVEVYRALEARTFRRLPVSPTAYGSVWDDAIKVMVKQVRASVDVHKRPSYREAANTMLNPARRAMLQRAAVRVENTPNDRYGHPIKPHAGVISGFLKLEKAMLTASGDVPAPRVISPRDDETAVMMRSLLHHLEKSIIGAIPALFGYQPVTKGESAEKVAKRFFNLSCRFNRPAYRSMDMSKFDSHVSQAALHKEHSVYLGIYEGTEHWTLLRALLAKQLVTVAYFRTSSGVLKFRKDGGRGSGDINTGLGNVLINCLLIYVYATLNSIPLGSFSLVNNGDDSVLVTEHEDCRWDGYAAFCLEHGFKVNVEDPVYYVEAVRYCQSFCMADATPLSVRDPARVAAKDTVTTRPMRTCRDLESMSKSISLGGTATAGGVPVLAALYDMIGRGIQSKVKPSAMYHEYGWADRVASVAHRRGMPVSDLARASFALATGIGVQLQLELERDYASRTLHRDVAAPPPCRGPAGLALGA